MSELDHQIRELEYQLFLLIDKHQKSKEEDKKQILQEIDQVAAKIEKLYEEEESDK